MESVGAHCCRTWHQVVSFRLDLVLDTRCGDADTLLQTEISTRSSMLQTATWGVVFMQVVVE